MFIEMVSGPDSSHSTALHELVAEIRCAREEIRKRWDVLDRGEIFHYTTADSAFAILNDLTLWSSDVLTMNDGSEFSYAVSIVDSVLMNRWDKLPIHVPKQDTPFMIYMWGQLRASKGANSE